jgi:type IV pilus assembly protein PilV
METARSPGRQSGYMLFEAMVALMIFTVGVLGIMGMVVVATQNNTDAKYRIEASLLVNELIGQMWADNRDPAVLTTNYAGGAGTDGAKYTAWLNDIIANKRLPGVEAGNPNVPSVVVTCIPSCADPRGSSQVFIRISWQLPGESSPHNHVAVTQISKSNE